jgi:methylase of polypeptide subunit release factors
VLETVKDVPLLVLPGVHNPVVFRSGRFLADAIDLCIASRERDAARTGALDLGTGSGVGAVFLARLGWRVVAVDTDPVAVRCARVNALLNGVEDRIAVRQGDLWGPVMGERFDVVTFNPPFFRGIPRDPRERHWRSPDVLHRFAAGLGDVLAPGGEALVVFSSDGDEPTLLTSLAAAGFIVTPAHHRDFGNEVMTAYRAVPAASA